MRSPGPHSKQGRPSTHCAFQPTPRPPHFTKEDPEPKGQAFCRWVGGGPGTVGSARGEGAGFAELGSAPGREGAIKRTRAHARKGDDRGRRWERKERLLRPMVPLRVREPRSRTQRSAGSAHSRFPVAARRVHACPGNHGNGDATAAARGRRRRVS